MDSFWRDVGGVRLPGEFGSEGHCVTQILPPGEALTSWADGPMLCESHNGVMIMWAGGDPSHKSVKSVVRRCKCMIVAHIDRLWC